MLASNLSRQAFKPVMACLPARLTGHRTLYRSAVHFERMFILPRYPCQYLILDLCLSASAAPGVAKAAKAFSKGIPRPNKSSSGAAKQSKLPAGKTSMLHFGCLHIRILIPFRCSREEKLLPGERCAWNLLHVPRLDLSCSYAKLNSFGHHLRNVLAALSYTSSRKLWLEARPSQDFSRKRPSNGRSCQIRRKL